MTEELTPDEIIDALGGTSKTARIFDLKDPSISGWRKNGIPNARLMYLKVARPDIFTSKRATDPAPNPGHAGRQLPSPSNIFDTVPGHCIVGVPVSTKEVP